MNVHFSSQRLDWRTPKAVYQILDAEFQFNYDPCPINPTVDGLTTNWGGATMLTRRMVENSQRGYKKAMQNGRKVRPSCF